LQAEPWTADRVVFLNDVFACAGDVARLLAHESAHLACGLDFDRPRIAQMDRQVNKKP
jgi:Cryptococcal mannosyltransferase 1